MKTFDMQTNNIAYSNFRNMNSNSRMTNESSTIHHVFPGNTTPIN